MDVFFVIRRERTSIFVDAKDSDKVNDLKQLISGITGKAKEDMKLFELKDDKNNELDDVRTLADCGISANTAKPQQPLTLGLVYINDGVQEGVKIEKYSTPPELPDVMKQSANDSSNAQSKEL